MSKKKFIYFPSLSCGEFGGHLMKDYKIADKIPARYYNADQPKIFRYPYILISGGHNLNHTREEFGCDENTLVIGDSGGYQIATGVKKWKPELLEETFNWLENNTDLAVNLDIPPRGAWEGKFDESLKITMENMEYFHTNQTGKTKFLNVLQGANTQQIDKWFKSVSKYDNFSGWSFGGSAFNISIMMYMFAVLFNNKEHLNDKREFIHILGTNRIEHFFLLIYLQKILNDLGSNAQITCDSSSPNRSVMFGTLYTGFSFRKMSYEIVKMPYRPLQMIEKYEEQLHYNTVTEEEINEIKEQVAVDKISAVDRKLLNNKIEGYNLNAEGVARVKRKIKEIKKTTYTHSLKVPFTTNYDRFLQRGLTFKEIEVWGPEARTGITLHNLYVLVDAIDRIEDLVNADCGLIEQLVPADFSKILESIKLMAQSDDPISIYKKYEPIYSQWDRATQPETQNEKNETWSDLFDFNN